MNPGLRDRRELGVLVRKPIGRREVIDPSSGELGVPSVSSSQAVLNVRDPESCAGTDRGTSEGANQDEFRVAHGLTLPISLPTSLSAPDSFEANRPVCSGFSDGPAWIRTRDQRIMSPLL
jgi:hypothetical protein